MDNNITKNIILEHLLQPMFYLLDKKNINNCVTYVVNDDKIYFCFEKNYLSETNIKLLVYISSVYCDNFFYSDDKDEPYKSRIAYWIPDSWYDEHYKVTERCNNKKFVVLELNFNDKFTILGTTIMLANILQEQNPLNISANKNKKIFTSDELERESHYLEAECPDLSWIDLSVILDKNNPLRDNPYANFYKYVCINSPVECDNVISAIVVGTGKKKTLQFNMDNDSLKEEIENFFNKCDKLDENNKIDCQAIKVLLPKFDI